MAQTTEQEKKPDEAQDKNAQNSAPPAPVPGKESKGKKISFKDKYEISLDQLVPEHCDGEVKAYEAHSKKTGERHIALICSPSLIPRFKDIPPLGSFVNAAILPVADSGIIFWPPGKNERFVIIYRDNFGQQLLKPGKPRALGLKGDILTEMAIKPIYKTLCDFYPKGFYHGNIRPEKMFISETANKVPRLILGDCISTPPGATQPSIYETIERSIAQPDGKGKGTLADDIYAFGVSLVVMLRHHDTTAEFTDNQLIRKKIEEGSFAALIGKDRITGSILELLRGILNDDEKQRWSLEEIGAWIDGRRLSPKQVRAKKKAARPLKFGDRNYLFPKVLAFDLPFRPKEAVALIESEQLQLWVERSLSDKELTETLERAITPLQRGSKGAHYTDAITSQAATALQSGFPIRYKNVSCFPSGLGTALAKAYLTEQDMTPYAEIFANDIAMGWVMSQDPGLPEISSLIAKFDVCKNNVRNTKPGYGLERCMYFLDRTIPCLSPALRDYYIHSPEDMLRAFEDMCQKNKMNGMFLDRHSIAYLLVADTKVIEPHMYDLSAAERYKVITANLNILAEIQRRGRIGNLPGIGGTFLKMLKEVYENFHDREVRQKLEESMEKYAKLGDIPKMADIIGNAEIEEKDFHSFLKAMQEYKEITEEYDALKDRLEKKASFGRSTGHTAAAVISSILGAVVVIGAFIYSLA